ncbi:MAG: Rieske (2Fe-2S) protein [Planctomycetota bacterium]|nr:Rieske (2Fe-2S) protein [Planctomycetota bacterium]
MTDSLVEAGTMEEIRSAGRKVVRVDGRLVLVLHHDGKFFALDNRCPHMGFPLDTGDVHDGLLDCHWHHARFDISCGATLDPWADDVDSYRVVVKDERVFVDPELPPRDPREHGLARLERGLEDNLRLVTAKAVLELAGGNIDPAEPIGAAALFGATEREEGWSSGLSILSAMANVLPSIADRDRARALVHAIARIAGDCAGRPPRRPLPPLTGSRRGKDGLRDWLRETVEVRDRDGADRVLRTIATELGPTAALDAVLASVTDHRYSDIGHTLDFALKCAEVIDQLGEPAPPDGAALLFTSLVPQLVQMQRMEETSAWRRPVDVATLVSTAEPSIPSGPFEHPADEPLADEEALVERLLEEDPAATVDDLMARLASGASPIALAEAVVMAATQRILDFGTANEFRDWDTVHHTLTYANAVAEGMRRVPSPELFRAVLDGAMSVYLDRFLNTPPANPLARVEPAASADGLLDELLAAYDRRSAVDEATHLAWQHLEAGGDPRALLETLGKAVVREDSGFHEFQQLDIAWRRLARRGPGRPANLALTATARWIAAQYPTRRAQEQTFMIAYRLNRGDAIHDG